MKREVALLLAGACLTLTPPLVCAASLMGNLSLILQTENPVYDGKSRHFAYQGVLKNISTSPIQAPISFVLKGLTAEQTSLMLDEVHGTLADGNPFMELVHDGELLPSQEIPVIIPFVLSNDISRLTSAALAQLANRSIKAFSLPKQANFSASYDLQRIPAGNRPPIANAGADWSTGLGAQIMLDGKDSSDPDHHPLSYSWTLMKSPSGSQVVLTAPNAMQTGLTPDVAGTYTIALVVNDGYVDSMPNLVNVVASPGGNTEQNQNPLITSIPSIGATGTRLYKYQVIANDPDGDPLTYSLTKSQMGMTIDPSTGMISWTPPQPHHDGMMYAVEVKVSDSRGGEARQSFSISVKICTCV